MNIIPRRIWSSLIRTELYNLFEYFRKHMQSITIKSTHIACEMQETYTVIELLVVHFAHDRTAWKAPASSCLRSATVWKHACAEISHNRFETHLKGRTPLGAQIDFDFPNETPKIVRFRKWNPISRLHPGVLYLSNNWLGDTKSQYA